MDKSMVTAGARYDSGRWDYKFVPDLFAADGYFDGIRSKRVLAYLIDIVILALFYLALYFVGTIFTVVTFGLLYPVMMLAAAVLPFAYHAFFIAGRKQSTPGMRVMGLKAYSWDGAAPNVIQSLLLAVTFYASMAITSSFILLVSLLNGRGRCFHDYLCGVFIVNDLEILPGE